MGLIIENSFAEEDQRPGQGEGEKKSRCSALYTSLSFLINFFVYR